MSAMKPMLRPHTRVVVTRPGTGTVKKASPKFSADEPLRNWHAAINPLNLEPSMLFSLDSIRRREAPGPDWLVA